MNQGQRNISTPQIWKGQQGIALIISLVLLIVATLLGMAGIRGSIMQERMSANMYDRSLAMQASEAALREAEERIAGDENLTVGVDCSGGDCDPIDALVSNDADWRDVSAAYATNAEVAAGGGTGQYYIQYMGSWQYGELDGGTANSMQYGMTGGAGGMAQGDARYYKVTARSHDPNAAENAGRAIVVLTTTVIRGGA